MILATLVGFAYRRPVRHPVPDPDDTGTQKPVSSTRNRHPVLDDGIGLKWGPGTVLDGSGTDPVPDNGVGIGIGRYRYRITVFKRIVSRPMKKLSRSTVAIASVDRIGVYS